VSELSTGSLHWLTPNVQFLALQVGPAGLGLLMIVAGYNFGLPLFMDAGAFGLAASAGGLGVRVYGSEPFTGLGRGTIGP
jgi:hypothetical protein